METIIIGGLVRCLLPGSQRRQRHDQITWPRIRGTIHRLRAGVFQQECCASMAAPICRRKPNAVALLRPDSIDASVMADPSPSVSLRPKPQDCVPATALY